MKISVINTSRGKEEFIEIDKYKGLIDTYYLMESCVYGDEVPCVIVDSKNKIVEWEWRDLLDTWIEENSIIEMPSIKI